MDNEEIDEVVDGEVKMTVVQMMQLVSDIFEDASTSARLEDISQLLSMAVPLYNLAGFDRETQGNLREKTTTLLSSYTGLREALKSFNIAVVDARSNIHRRLNESVVSVWSCSFWYWDTGPRAAMPIGRASVLKRRWLRVRLPCCPRRDTMYLGDRKPILPRKRVGFVSS